MYFCVIKYRMTSINKILISFAVIMLSNFVLHSQTLSFGDKLNNTSAVNTKPQLSVSLTTSFAAFSPGFTTFGTTLMPKVTFPITDKFSLSTGVGYSTLFMGAGSGSMFNSTPSSYGHIFVSGTYDVNEKISLRGTGYKTFNLNTASPMISDDNSMGYDYSSQGFIMDVEYRVTDNFRINVGFEYREQNTPMYNPNGFQQDNPFTNPVLPFHGFNNHNNLVPF